MPSLCSLAFLTVAASVVQGHFTFMRLKTDGEWHKPLQFVRNKTAPFEEKEFVNANYKTRIYHEPTYYVDFPDSVRCGRGNMDHASETDILTVKAGDEIQIAHHNSEPVYWKEEEFNCANGAGTCRPGSKMHIQHPGPLLIHLSKVPEDTDIKDYHGDGEWVKIHTRGLRDITSRPLFWELYGDSGDWESTHLPPPLTFTIPPSTPSGQYLMRMDVIWAYFYSQWTPQEKWYAQMYPTCAQLNVVSESTAEWPPKDAAVKIPEIFFPGQLGMATTQGMYNNRELDANYTYPGGMRWTGTETVVDKPEGL